MRTFQAARCIEACLCFMCVAGMELGCQSLTDHAVNFPSPPALPPAARFELGTSSFVPGGNIPKACTCDGLNNSPGLAWIGPPSRTQTFVLIMEEAEAAQGRSIHWIVYNIPATATGLLEATPEGEELSGGAHQGVNDLGKLGYSGPCPQPGKGHRYIFRLYGLDVELPPKPRASPKYVETTMKDHILRQAEITGVYSRESPGSPK